MHASSQTLERVKCILTWVAVEMCKVSEVGTGSCVRISRGCENVSTEVAEEVKLLIVVVLLVVMVRCGAAHHRRLE